MSASGIRAIRYVKEIEGVQSVVANDCDARAVDLIGKNVSLNNASEFVEVAHADAVDCMRMAAR